MRIDLSGTTPSTAGHVLQLVRRGLASTRPDIASVTGLGRSAVSQRVDALMTAGLLVEDGDVPSTGGRPAARLVFDGRDGVVLVADLGATHCRLAVVDLHGEILVQRPADLLIADGPDIVLPWVCETFDELLQEVGRTDADVRAVGVGLPGPVEFAAGRAVSPPIMPGWHGVSVPDRVRTRFDVPVLVDNDVNLMVLGEYFTNWRERVHDLLFVKIGTGIGLGIVVGGDVHRGARGAAGDVGHIEVAGSDVVCRCGNVGCVEATAGGRALAAELRALGRDDMVDTRDVVRVVREGDSQAVRLVRDAGRAIGHVLAGLVNTFNPAALVVGGDLAEADQWLLAGIREVIYQRSTALATESLQLAISELGDLAGIHGGAVLATEHVLAPTTIDTELATNQTAPDPTS